MKRRAILVFSTIIVLCMLLSTFGVVKAAPLHNDPVVTVISGGENLKSTVVPFGNLPGIVVGDSGLILPINSPNGDMQFGGDGIQLSGLAGGSASVCFSMLPTRYGWSGIVYQYNGTKWVKLDTVVTESEEALDAKVCATVYSDGFYALILGFKEPIKEDKAKKQIKECTNITFIYPDLIEDEELPRLYIPGGFVYPSLPLGTKVTYELLNIDPPNSLTGPGTKASGIVIRGEFDPEIPNVEFPKGTYLDYSSSPWNITFTVRFYTQGCYKDFHYPEDLPWS